MNEKDYYRYCFFLMYFDYVLKKLRKVKAYKADML